MAQTQIAKPQVATTKTLVAKARPRASQLPAIASLRTMGKREANARLAALAGG